MIDFTARYPIILTLLFLAFSAVVSIYFYRNYPLRQLKKYFMIAFKTAAIFLLLILFIEPSLLTLSRNDSGIKNLVLVDNSRSNLLNGADGEPKSIECKNILSEVVRTNSYRVFTFSSSEASLISITDPDSILFEGYETDLTNTLDKLKASLVEESIGALTVISDGIFNSGGNPLYSAKQFQCPVITIGIGDTIQKNDAVLNAVYFDQNAFTNTINIIRVAASFHLLSNETFEINLFREGSLIQTETIPVNEDFQSEHIDFQIREANPGIVRYSIKVSEQSTEINHRNNRQEILINYIDNKTNILLISSGPGYDNSVIQNILKNTNNYNLTVRTVKSPNEFYEGNIDYKTFGELSAVFLLGFPISSFNSEVTGNFASKVLEFNVPLIFFAQKNTDYKKLEAFGEQIPFYVTGTQSVETHFIPQSVASAENSLKNIEGKINLTPQIFKNISGISPKAGCVTLLTNKSSGEPVLLTRNSGKTKSTAFLGYGLWRWDLNENQSHRKILEEFIIECVNLSLIKEKKTKLKVYPVKDVFDFTQKIKLIAEVYDDEYRLTRNAKVTARILQNGSVVSSDISFAPDGNNYSVILSPLPAGDYKIEAEAELLDNFYANDESRFLVDSLNTDFLSTKSNFENLRELSLNTGGKFFDASQDPAEITDEISSLVAADIQNSHARKNKFNLWENKYLLLLTVFLFSLEWILRKRNNIP